MTDRTKTLSTVELLYGVPQSGNVVLNLTAKNKPKLLLIRFSSLGDVTQCLSVPTRLKELVPHGEIHWVIRSDLAELLKGHPFIDKVWEVDKSSGFKGLWQTILALKKQNYSHIYDAHNNLRSHLICWFLKPPLALSRIMDPPLLLRKSQKRWKRFLLFRFRINLFQMPFSGQRDLLEPLTSWGLSKELPPPPQIRLDDQSILRAQKALKDWTLKPFIALAPSAAYPLKRWPLDHWKKLIYQLSQHRFVLLGGVDDNFLEELEKISPDRVLNLGGKTSLLESAAVISSSSLLVSNDTGLLHIAEQLGRKCIALMGPAPFGFPSRESTQIMELELNCRPCSKHGQGPCTNTVYQRCLVEISPEKVAEKVQSCLIS